MSTDSPRTADSGPRVHPHLFAQTRYVVIQHQPSYTSDCDLAHVVRIPAGDIVSDHADFDEARREAALLNARVESNEAGDD